MDCPCFVFVTLHTTPFWLPFAKYLYIIIVKYALPGFRRHNSFNHSDNAVFTGTLAKDHFHIVIRSNNTYLQTESSKYFPTLDAKLTGIV